MFNLKEAPFLLIVLLSLITWTVNKLVSITIEHPIIEYNQSNGIEGDVRYVDYKISNLTPNKIFTDIKFTVCIPTKSKGLILLKPKIIPYAPNTIDVTDWDTSGICNEFIFLQLYPKSEFTLRSYYKGELDSRTFTFTFNVTEPDEPFYMLARNPRTFIVRYQTRIYICLLVVWFIVLTIYLINLKKHSDES